MKRLKNNLSHNPDMRELTDAEVEERRILLKTQASRLVEGVIVLPTQTESSIPRKTSKRDRALEAQRAQLSFFSGVSDLRQKREAGELDETWQIAQALMLCGMPQTPTKENHWVKRAKLAKEGTLRVTFATTEKDVPLPYGQDRGPLYYLMHKALRKYKQIERELDADPRYTLTDQLDDDEFNRRTTEREAKLDQARLVDWNTATEYTNKMELKGGNPRNVLRERIKRLCHCAISIVRETAKGDEHLLLPILASSCLPNWAKDVKDKKPAQSDDPRSKELSVTGKTKKLYGFEIGRGLFKDYVLHHVPVPEEVIIALMRRPTLLDLFVWLCWRVYAAKSDTFIPINEIKEQIGSSDSNVQRILNQLKQTVKIAQATGWKELRAEVVSRPRSRKVAESEFPQIKAQALGILLGPSHNHVQFSGSSKKRIQSDIPASDRKRVQKIIEDSLLKG
jgi:hypothetical protein